MIDHFGIYLKKKIFEYENIKIFIRHYDIVQDMSSNTREMKRKVLYNMINAILVRNVELDLHYYQGFHDVCSVFLLTMGKKEAFVLAERVSISYFR